MNVLGRDVIGNLQDQMSLQDTTENIQVLIILTIIVSIFLIFRSKALQMPPVQQTVLKIRSPLTAHEETLGTSLFQADRRNERWYLMMSQNIPIFSILPSYT